MPDYSPELFFVCNDLSLNANLIQTILQWSVTYLVTTDEIALDYSTPATIEQSGYLLFRLYNYVLPNISYMYNNM